MDNILLEKLVNEKIQTTYAKIITYSFDESLFLLQKVEYPEDLSRLMELQQSAAHYLFL